MRKREGDNISIGHKLVRFIYIYILEDINSILMNVLPFRFDLFRFENSRLANPASTFIGKKERKKERNRKHKTTQLNVIARPI